ncbi:MAG: tetratricopeptide repeat protein [Gemmatimonadales bacterium]
MKALYSSLFAAATATIVAAAPAFAQTPAAATCEIDQGRPQPVARATLSLTRANVAAKSGDPTKDLKDVVAILTAPNLKDENPLGRAFLLASAYVYLLEQPAIQPISTRGAIGITTNPTATIDLFAAADSNITIVEKSSPACMTYMQPFRQQKAWLNVTNAAINALNANKLDSAEILAKRSLLLDRRSPYAYSVLASVARARKNTPALVEYSRQVLTAAGKDTAYADVRERALYDLTMAQTDRAKAATGAEKKTLAREAIPGWTELAQSNDNIQATIAIRNLTAMYIAAGDSAQLRKIYEPMIKDATKYSEGALLEAGVVAAQQKRPDEAVILFERVVQINPYSRDAINNLAASYLQTGETEKVTPLIDKLVAMDPGNPDNYMLYAFTYAGKLKKKSDAKMTRTYNDSLMYWNTKSEKMPVKVSFTEFSRNSDGTVLVGAVENRGTAAKSYTLSFEFLGPKGEVLFTESQTVGPVSAKGSKEFRIRNPKTGVAGYRYKLT